MYSMSFSKNSPAYKLGIVILLLSIVGLLSRVIVARPWSVILLTVGEERSFVEIFVARLVRLLLNGPLALFKALLIAKEVLFLFSVPDDWAP